MSENVSLAVSPSPAPGAELRPALQRLPDRSDAGRAEGPEQPAVVHEVRAQVLGAGEDGREKTGSVLNSCIVSRCRVLQATPRCAGTAGPTRIRLMPQRS